jgi:hypothetical protein
MHGAIPPLLNAPPWSGAQLKKHRDNFTLPLCKIDQKHIVMIKINVDIL